MRIGRISPTALAQLHGLLEQERHHYEWEFLLSQKARVFADLHRLTSFIDQGFRFKIDEEQNLYWHQVKKTPFVLAYRILEKEVRVIRVKYKSAKVGTT